MSNRKLWTTKDGRKIRIKDMTDKHLGHTIRMLERAHENARDVDYPCFQGEMAQLYAERDWEALQITRPGDLFPIYWDLLDEAERRATRGIPK